MEVDPTTLLAMAYSKVDRNLLLSDSFDDVKKEIDGLHILPQYPNIAISRKGQTMVP